MKTRSSDEGRKLQVIAEELWTMAREREDKAEEYSAQTAELVQAYGFAYEKAAQLLERKAGEADNETLKTENQSNEVDRQITASQRMAAQVEVKEDGTWRTTLHPSEAAAEWFISHTENETRRGGR